MHRIWRPTARYFSLNRYCHNPRIRCVTGRQVKPLVLTCCKSAASAFCRQIDQNLLAHGGSTAASQLLLLVHSLTGRSVMILQARHSLLLLLQFANFLHGSKLLPHKAHNAAFGCMWASTYLCGMTGTSENTAPSAQQPVISKQQQQHKQQVHHQHNLVLQQQGEPKKDTHLGHCWPEPQASCISMRRQFLPRQAVS